MFISFWTHSRPVQKIILPSYTQLLKPSPYTLRPSYATYSHLKPVVFQSSPPGPNTGEYIYENPYPPANVYMSQPAPSGPIHTIPAPNLSPVGPLAPISPIHSNHIYEAPTPTITPYYSPPRPVSVKPYQVTEEPTNDLTLHDPLSGKQTYFAPDPDPRLPVAKVPLETTRFGQPSNGKPHDYSYPHHHPASRRPHHSNPSAATQHILQYVKLGTRPIFPRMQKQVVQQMSMLHGMPDSVYNPTYLVTQSNNLLQQHQQHLFRPEPAYVSAYQQQHAHPQTHLTTHDTETYESAASPGQIYAAQHDQLHHQQDALHHQHDQYQHQDSQNLLQQDESAAYKQLLDQATQYFQSGAYLNYPHSVSSTRAPYVAESAPTPAFYYAPDLAAKHQEENARILEQANAELMEKGYSAFHDEPEASFSHQSPIISESANSDKKMRIYVPDDEFTTDTEKVKLQNRSDDTTTKDADQSEKAQET
ncbi:segmentation polarity homeobox protein engrailed [Phlebotomus argentipes]|uniref:segmentation polarity homeobox protein engrailed n=1 Tax=Phlebotomus argentipes TaxID=94469 RepID=UPI002892EAF6|nr:segmentation polarity homeobox protein engrailed [Phlebotomus argentipes]